MWPWVFVSSHGEFSLPYRWSFGVFSRAAVGAESRRECNLMDTSANSQQGKRWGRKPQIQTELLQHPSSQMTLPESGQACQQTFFCLFIIIFMPVKAGLRPCRSLHIILGTVPCCSSFLTMTRAQPTRSAQLLILCVTDADHHEVGIYSMCHRWCCSSTYMRVCHISIEII